MTLFIQNVHGMQEKKKKDSIKKPATIKDAKKLILGKVCYPAMIHKYQEMLLARFNKQKKRECSERYQPTEREKKQLDRYVNCIDTILHEKDFSTHESSDCKQKTTSRDINSNTTFDLLDIPREIMHMIIPGYMRQEKYIYYHSKYVRHLVDCIRGFINEDVRGIDLLYDTPKLPRWMIKDIKMNVVGLSALKHFATISGLQPINSLRKSMLQSICFNEQASNIFVNMGTYISIYKIDKKQPSEFRIGQPRTIQISSLIDTFSLHPKKSYLAISTQQEVFLYDYMKDRCRILLERRVPIIRTTSNDYLQKNSAAALFFSEDGRRVFYKEKNKITQWKIKQNKAMHETKKSKIEQVAPMANVLCVGCNQAGEHVVLDKNDGKILSIANMKKSDPIKHVTTSLSLKDKSSLLAIANDGSLAALTLNAFLELIIWDTRVNSTKSYSIANLASTVFKISADKSKREPYLIDTIPCATFCGNKEKDALIVSLNNRLVLIRPSNGTVDAIAQYDNSPDLGNIKLVVANSNKRRIACLVQRDKMCDIHLFDIVLKEKVQQKENKNNIS